MTSPTLPPPSPIHPQLLGHTSRTPDTAHTTQALPTHLKVGLERVQLGVLGGNFFLQRRQLRLAPATSGGLAIERFLGVLDRQLQLGTAGDNLAPLLVQCRL